MWQGFLPNNIKYTGNFVSFANLASLRGIEQLYFIGVLFYREKLRFHHLAMALYISFIDVKKESFALSYVCDFMHFVLVD